MADRKPIVYVDGYPQELATGDRLAGVGAVTVSATQPSTATTGDLWLNSTNEILSVYDGSAWTETKESESFVKVQNSVPSSGITGQLWLILAATSFIAMMEMVGRQQKLPLMHKQMLLLLRHKVIIGGTRLT